MHSYRRAPRHMECCARGRRMRARRCFMVVLCASWSLALEISPAAAQSATPVVARAAEGTFRPTVTTATSAGQREPVKPIGPEEWKRRLREAQAQLQAVEPAVIEQALVSLRELAGRESALAIMERVQKGL